ncbi:MAG TPA: hypothetical protein VFF59_12685, partial [Anaerolineae bacterium]|nr:hypothetical protein [Anaerolineae bacterium]
MPGPTGGSVSALVMSPAYTSDHTVFAGLRGHGVYRSTDGGNGWQPSGLSDQVIIDLAISPDFASDRTLFAAVGLGPGGYNVYRSTDGGTTWQLPYVTPYDDGFQPLIRLSLSPNYGADHTVYALGATETYKSTDGGRVFARMGGWYATHHITALAFSPAFDTDHTVFAAVQGGGIMKSLDSGSTWAATSFDFNFTFTALAVSPNYPNDLTVAAINGYNGQLYLSTDGGATRRGYSLFLGAGDKHTLLFSPTFADDHLMLAASSGDPGAYRSIDGGETWTPVGWYDPAHPYWGGFVGGSIFALAIPPNTVENDVTLAGTSSGLYLSRDRGQSWDQNNTGLPPLSLRSFAIAPNNPATILAGTSFFEHKHFNAATPIEADGNLQLSFDGGRSWHAVSGRLDRVRRVAFSPDFANDHTAFACAGVVGDDGYTGGGVYRSIDDARHWTALISLAACTDLALSPNYTLDRTAWVYVLGQGILRTTNGGDTWDVLNNDFVADTLTPSPNYPTDQTLFASTPDARLLKSIDGGETWTPVLSYAITALAISPAYGASQTLYAGVRETASSSGDIYRSSDGGTNWQKLNTGIPSIWNNQPSTISAIEFAKDSSIIAGVTYGDAASGAVVYRSIDSGQTWQLLGGGLGDSGLFDLTSLSNAGESDQRGAFTFLAGTAHAIARLDLQQRDPTEPGAWYTTGPRGGRADVLVVSPNFATDGVAFTGESNWFHFNSQYGRGIFKSTDGGQTWRASNNGLQNVRYPGYSVNGFAFSPNFATDKTVFEASWDGLFKSTDGGENWQLLAGFQPGTVNPLSGIFVAPNHPTSGHMLARGTYGCLFRSTDFGAHWATDCTLPFYDFAYSPNFAADNTLFASGGAVAKSIDAGLTWTRVFTAPTGGVAVSPQYAVDRTLFTGGDGLYKSTDGGTTWISVTIGISTSTIGTPAISPDFATDHTLFVTAGNQLYRSGDGGLTWNLMPSAPNLPLGPIVISPGWPAHPYLLIGTAQG